MSHYEPHNYPDNPYRVAPPFCAPGEIEPPDPPQVSQDEAVLRVIDLLYNDIGKSAFDETGKMWVERLMDKLFEMQDMLVYGMLVGDYTTFRKVRDAVRQFVHQHANEQLAEMSSDQLDAEGLA